MLSLTVRAGSTIAERALFHLELLGGAGIRGPDGQLAGRIAQRRQLALLAFLALHERPVARDRLLPVFWPESDTDRARRALSDAVYIIRKTLGEGALRSHGDDLAIDAQVVSSDVAAFEQALKNDRPERAVELYAGPFLDGFHLADAPEFDAWQCAQRERLSRTCLIAAERAAEQCESAGEVDNAIAWWRKAATLEPHNSRIALRLVQSLVARGDHVGAIRASRTHTHLLAVDYGIDPPAELTAYLEELPRTSPPDEGKQPDDTPGSHVVPRRAREVLPIRVGSVTGHGAREHSPRRLGARRAWMFVPAALLLTAGSIGVMRYNRAAEVAALDPKLVLVLPFRTAGLHPELTYLGEGLVDLMSAKLTGEAGGLRALPPSTPEITSTIAAQVHAVPATALAIARRVRAGSLLQGSVVGAPGTLSIQLTLLDVATARETARAAVQGTEAELHGLIDRAVGEILSRTAQEPEHRLAHLTSASLPALRVFLAARAAHRRGEYEEALHLYGRALDLDSTFALAGLGAVAVGGWVGGSAPIANRGSRVASVHRDRLSEYDRVGLLGRVGAASGEASTTRVRIAQIEEALRRYPDHARLWYLRGDEHMHLGAATGIADWTRRARESFERAISLDEDYADPVHHLATVLALIPDTAALRALVDRQLGRVPTGPVADYLRWLARWQIGAPYQERPFRDLHTDATLRWIGIVAQDYGIGVPDGPAAVQLRLERPGIRDEIHERRMGALAWALNGGRREDALAVLRSLPDVQSDPDFHHRIGVLAALFADGDSATGAMSARALRRTRARGNVPTLNECIRTLWLLYEQPAAVPRPEILSDEQAFARDAGAFAVPRRMCLLVRDAQWLSRTGGAEWHAAISRLDRLLATGPVRGLVDNGHSEYVHLALARLYEAIGEPEQALRALRRRSRYNGWQPYLASILRAEARISATLGDSAGAHRANQHREALRAAVR